MKHLAKRLLGAGLLIGLLAAAFVAGVVLAPALRSSRVASGVLQSPASTRIEQDMAVLWEAWRLIDRNYFGKLPDQNTLAGGAIVGLLSALADPYSAYQTADEVASYERELDGSLQSLGMAVEKRDSALLVIAPLASSPAQRAGIYPGDQIVHIDGRDTALLTLGQAVSLLRGPAGSTVTLGVVRENSAELSLTVQRAALTSPVFSSQLLPDGMLYVNIALFDDSIARDLNAVLQRPQASALRGIVIDLRNNPGGYLDVAIEAAGQFISDGVIVSQQGRTGMFTWSFVDQGRTIAIAGPDGKKSSSPARFASLAGSVPLVVLVNRGTASAAEVLAAALQDHGRAILLGEHTFGKSAVTGDYTLANGSSIHMTNGQWLSPRGRSVNGSGLTPDVETTNDPADPDRLVQQAREILLGRR